MGVFKKGTLEPVTGSPIVTPPGGKGPLKGLDIYHGDDISSWTKLAANNSFIFMKASEGTSYRDSKFGSYWKLAKTYGIMRGAYHFMHWDMGSGAAQAKYFKAAIDNGGGMEKGDLPPVCDWEYSSGGPKASNLKVGKEFLEEIAHLTGRRPIIYVSASVPGELGEPSWMADYPLWIASYRASPRIPKPWTNWTFWQNAEDASIPGLGNKGDSDFFNGNLEDLKRL